MYKSALGDLKISFMASVWGTVVKIPSLWNNGQSGLQKLLKCSASDVVKFCINAGVNKWSLRKPMNYGANRFTTLTDKEMAGTQAERNAGYYYGIKMSDNSFNNIAGIHIAEVNLFEHKKFEAGNAARLDDFYNYDHAATADVSLDGDSLPTEIYESRSFKVTLVINKSGYGVPFTEVMRSVLNGGIGEGTYLMAILSKAEDIGRGDGAHSFTRISETPIDFDTSATLEYEVDSSMRSGDYYFSFFLYAPRNATEVANMPALGEWKDANGFMTTSHPIVVPEGYKRAISVLPIIELPYIYQAEIDATTLILTVRGYLSEVPESFIFRVYGTVNFGGGVGHPVEFEGRTIHIAGTEATCRFLWSDIAPDALIIKGQPVNASLTFLVYVDNGATWGKATSFELSTTVRAI